MKKAIFNILANIIPSLFMVLLISFIQNDYYLTLVYIGIIAIALFIKYEAKEYLFFLFGLVIITFFEWVFVSTGAEIFLRRSLFGVMPIWLPLLWAYSFIAIKRAVESIYNLTYQNE